MFDPVSRHMGMVLHRAILVGAVLLTMKFVSVGVYRPALALSVPLAVFGYMRFTDAALLR